ncbi:MAG: nucleoside monophosphate kinase [Patescibacteria group bacterium]
MSDPQAFIFFGASGSGKGTQAKLLLEYLEKKNRKAIHIETGQKVREFIASDDSYTSVLTKHVIDHGGLLPVFVPIWLWTEVLNKDFTGKEDLILDGVCRRVPEAPVLDSVMKFYKLQKPIVISLNVSDKWAEERLKSRGRTDDVAKYVKSRLDWFKKDVVPAIEYFRDNPDYIFLDVNGEKSIEEVHENIVSHIS